MLNQSFLDLRSTLEGSSVTNQFSCGEYYFQYFLTRYNIRKTSRVLIHSRNIATLNVGYADPRLYIHEKILYN